ncbi:hypothetical protein AAG570_006563 [Ranatra chinensis]|uniref:Uncharacterized protein n=1 Tax=Ranatra chinensis TaxID=642074 RepID=A0ABD0YUZ3_9HEMI
MASKRRNMFYENKNQDTTEICTRELPSFCDCMSCTPSDTIGTMKLWYIMVVLIAMVTYIPGFIGGTPVAERRERRSPLVGLFLKESQDPPTTSRPRRWFYKREYNNEAG